MVRFSSVEGRAFFTVKNADFINITMLNKEYHGLNNSEKKSTFDLLCRDDDTGEEFLVELQNANKTSFRERVLF